LRLGTLVTLATAFAAACSSRSLDADSAQTNESELRTLVSSEIVGPIAYDTTSDWIHHSGSPMYRALQLEGNAGDQLDIGVKTNAVGDARAWLLRSDFTNLAYNDDASENTKDARLVVTLPQAGRYYIAFREASFAPADFQASVRWANRPCTDACALHASGCTGVQTTSCIAGPNGCTQWGPPVACPYGACTNGACPACAPLTKADACGEALCGTAADGCGGTIACGDCADGERCSHAVCVVRKRMTPEQATAKLGNADFVTLGLATLSFTLDEPLYVCRNEFDPNSACTATKNHVSRALVKLEHTRTGPQVTLSSVRVRTGFEEAGCYFSEDDNPGARLGAPGGSLHTTTFEYHCRTGQMWCPSRGAQVPRLTSMSCALSGNTQLTGDIYTDGIELKGTIGGTLASLSAVW